jgi:FKBP-type peptidyl-prolyl cis-trans isomerase FklB
VAADRGQYVAHDGLRSRRAGLIPNNWQWRSIESPRDDRVLPMVCAGVRLRYGKTSPRKSCASPSLLPSRTVGSASRASGVALPSSLTTRINRSVLFASPQFRVGQLLSMKKPFTFLVCILGLGMTLQVRIVAAEGPTAGRSSKPSVATAQSSSGTTNRPDLALKDAREKASYALGLNLGNNLRKQSAEIDPNILLRGLKDALAGAKTLMSEDEARAALAQLQQDLRAKQEEKMRYAAETNKTEGEGFLAANKTREGVVTLPSGLQYKVLTPGSGRKPALSDTVVCNYRGTLINGTEFDSSYKRGEAATFPVSGVIKGWTEALLLMPVGSTWQLFVPAELAYGERGIGNDIGPDATLIFEVELISIQGRQ